MPNVEPDSFLLPAPLSACEAKRICLIKPSSLGDVAQALPILHALRWRFPGAHISWLVNRAYAPLLRPIRELNEVIEFDRSSYKPADPRSWRRFSEFLRGLTRRRFDLVVDLQCLLRSGLMTAATRASIRIGLQSAREGAGLFYTHVAQDACHQLAVDRYWMVADLLGAGNLPKVFDLGLTLQEREQARQRLATLPRPLVGVNPGARWETKRWPADRFAQVLQEASRGDDGPGAVVILGGPGEEPMAHECAQGLRIPAVNLCGKTELRELAAILAECDLLLTNDTGPMHLASAVGTPTVSLFTCTSPQRAAPFGESHRIIQTSVSCRGSYLRQCDRMDCMRDLTVDLVLPVLTGALNEVTGAPCCYAERANHAA